MATDNQSKIDVTVLDDNRVKIDFDVQTHPEDLNYVLRDSSGTVGVVYGMPKGSHTTWYPLGEGRTYVFWVDRVTGYGAFRATQSVSITIPMTFADAGHPDLATFLLARIAEDEAVAWSAAFRHGSRWGHEIAREDDSHAVLDRDDKDLLVGVGEDASDPVLHAARHDPARVLAECEAKRRIVDLHSSPGEYIVCPAESGRYRWDRCPTLLALALPFADHPDYREQWRP